MPVMPLDGSSRCCALCGAKRKLEQSHVIPQFVYRWANEGTVAGEKQVGLVRPLLCGRCEDRFSFFESEFARHVFHPVAANSFRATKYGGWLRKFAASVCWRILEEHAATQSPAHCGGAWIAERESCRTTWRDYLMGRRRDVVCHHLHLLPVGAAINGPGWAGPAQRESLVRLPLRSIASQVFCDEAAPFVYVKLGPIVLLGLIAGQGVDRWPGTRINAEGKIKPHDLFVPEP